MQAYETGRSFLAPFTFFCRSRFSAEHVFLPNGRILLELLFDSLRNELERAYRAGVGERRESNGKGANSFRAVQM